MQRRLASSSLFAIGMRKQSECKECKETFWHTNEHAYHGCCSWRCLCRFREKQGDKRILNGRKRVIIQTEEQALARIAECEERIAQCDEALRSGMLNRNERKSKNGLLWDWRRKLNDAKATLDNIRGEADEQTDS